MSRNPGRLLKWMPLQGLLFVAMLAATLISIPGANPAGSHPRQPAPAPQPAPLREIAPDTVITAKSYEAVAQPEQGAAEPAAVPGAVSPHVPVRKLLAISRWLHDGEYAWDDSDAPAQGTLAVVVDLRQRLISVYRGGVEIGRSAIIYGADDKPTPLGTFPILEKDADHVSNLYDAPMPYMMRLTRDGVALHGSAELNDYVATNGCIGLPDDFAAKLFAQARIGDRVIVLDSSKA